MCVPLPRHSAESSGLSQTPGSVFLTLLVWRQNKHLFTGWKNTHLVRHHSSSQPKPTVQPTQTLSPLSDCGQVGVCAFSSLTSFSSHLRGSHVVLVLADTECQRRTHHAGNTNSHYLERNSKIPDRAMHTASLQLVPDIDETAGGQVNPISQQSQQLHSVIQTQRTTRERFQEALSSSGGQTELKNKSADLLLVKMYPYSSFPPVPSSGRSFKLCPVSAGVAWGAWETEGTEPEILVVVGAEVEMEEGAGGASGGSRTAAGFSGFRGAPSVLISCIYREQ